MKVLESVYMRWAKEHAAARFNLANSGLLGCGPDDLGLAPEEVRDGLPINGPNADGLPALREAIAARYGVEADRVVLAPGASGANFLAFAALVGPGDVVLVERPAYEPILAALGFLGADVRRFARRFADRFRPDLAELREKLAGGVRLVVLTSPHNPSGMLVPPEDLEEIGRLAADAGALVLVDEVYRDIWFEDAPPSHVHLGSHFLATSSLTKCYGLSGLRCGWILAAPDLARRMLRLKDLMEAVGPLPAEALGVAAFRHLPRLEARSRALVEPNHARVRAFLEEHADVLEAVLPDRSLIVFPRLKREPDAGPLHDRLRRLDTSIAPGSFFEEPRHFRLGFAVETENVERGLESLGRALRDGVRRGPVDR